MVSLLVHIILLFLFLIPSSSKEKPEIIEIDIQDNKVLPPQKQPKEPEGGRIGSNQYRDGEGQSLDKRILVDDYFARLKARIEPNWIRFMDDEFRASRKNLIRNCDITLNINANENGLILSIIVIQSCGWKLAEDIAIRAINYSGIIPPPKDLLRNGILYLTWTFEIHK